MRTIRVHTSQELGPGHEVVLADGAAHYLCRVLRVGLGRDVTLFNGDGYDYPAEVRRAGRREVALSVMSRSPGLPEPGLTIVIAQALSRGERMDQTLQKCTELGAAAFLPLLSERVEVRLPAEKVQRRMEHWRGVIISACEQSGRARIPGISAPLSVPDWLDQPADGRRLVLEPGAEPLVGETPVRHRITLAVGPEGGFSAAEIALMRERGVKPFSLGPRVLRTETAGPAAVAVLQALGGDFR